MTQVDQRSFVQWRAPSMAPQINGVGTTLLGQIVALEERLMEVEERLTELENKLKETKNMQHS